MGRAPCCQKVGLRRGKWTSEEDETLSKYIQANGEGSWRSVPTNAGLLRCGKSCRLRWINYLRGDLKRGNITHQEDEMIFNLHKAFGNRWSMIASHLPGRTDNEIKNYWNTHLSRCTYRFMKTKNKTQTSIDISTLNQKTKRSGRVSRSVAKKYNKNKNNMSVPFVCTPNKSFLSAEMDVTNSKKEGEVCEKLGWNELGMMDIDDEDEKMKKNEWGERLGLEGEFWFDEIEWDMEFGVMESNVCDKEDDMLVWLWEEGNIN